MRYDIDALGNRSPDALRAFDRFIGPALERYFHPVVRGIERIPKGAALYVANHNGATVTPDTFVFCHEVLKHRTMDDIPYGLAHEIPIQVPGLHHLLVPLGAVRASHENARRIFDCGKKALVYPGGDVDAMRAWSERKRILFDSRVGYIRLALRSGVSIVPLVSAGAHEVLVVFHHGRGLAARVPFLRRFRLKAWPISFTIPWGITMGPMPPFVPLPTRIFQELLPPIHFDRSGESAATDALCVRECDARVRAAMQDTLTRLYAERDGE